MQFVWEYQCSPNKWLEYTREINDFLNSASSNKQQQPVAEYELEGWKMEFDFQQMRQRNVESKFVRSIRCAIVSQNKDDEQQQQKVVWCYQGERRRWISFMPQLAVQCEQHFQKYEDANNIGSEECTLFKSDDNWFGGKEVSIDLENKLMLVDGEEQRLIKRLESKAGPPDTSDRPHPKSTPSKIRERTCRLLKETDQKNIKKEGKQRIRKIKTMENQKAGETVEKIKSQVKRRKQHKEKLQITEEEESAGDENVNIEESKKIETEAVDQDKSLTIKKKKLQKEFEKIEGTENLQAEPEVDIECTELLGRVYVYANSEGNFYDVMLNQTNIQQNNNKFYLMQLLESSNNSAQKEYWVWFRWGRVGFKGQTNLTPFGDNLNGALELFHKKFWDKTHNDFLLSKNCFQKVQGKYDLIRIDHTKSVATNGEEMVKDGNSANTEIEEEASLNGVKMMETGCCMDERVKQLMQTICDLKTMESEARRLDYDFKRIPLGKITKEQIRAGNEALSRIENHIREANFDRDFADAVNEYYTRIPHSFGMRTPPMIRTMDALKQEVDLLDLLTGIQIAVAEIAGDPLEQHYSRLKWELVPLEKEDQRYKIVQEYLLNTQGPTHNTYRLALKNVFELSEKAAQNMDEKKKFRKELNNRKLLWHGSRLTNWYGILAQGLRIAPPEAPSTGYMFGKGVYFADIASKSANYSMMSGRTNCPAYMLLAEVALGQPVELRDSDDQMHRKLPNNKHSVKGVGKLVPRPDGTKLIDDGVEVPCGKPMELDDAGACSLVYNEYIVYSRDQIRERFLVEVAYQFDFDL